jgi:hypothetical protein
MLFPTGEFATCDPLDPADKAHLFGSTTGVCIGCGLGKYNTKGVHVYTKDRPSPEWVPMATPNTPEHREKFVLSVIDRLGHLGIVRLVWGTES